MHILYMTVKVKFHFKCLKQIRIAIHYFLWVVISPAHILYACSSFTNKIHYTSSSKTVSLGRKGYTYNSQAGDELRQKSAQIFEHSHNAIHAVTISTPYMYLAAV